MDKELIEDMKQKAEWTYRDALAIVDVPEVHAGIREKAGDKMIAAIQAYAALCQAEARQEEQGYEVGPCGSFHKLQANGLCVNCFKMVQPKPDSVVRPVKQADGTVKQETIIRTGAMASWLREPMGKTDTSIADAIAESHSCINANHEHSSKESAERCAHSAI